MNRVAFFTALAAAVSFSSSAIAAGTCPPLNGNLPDPGPPKGQVRVTINWLHLNEDMDPSLPFIDNHSDIFGKITIDADGTPETFPLRQIDGDDNPAWGDIFVSRPAPAGRPVHVTIHMEDDDDGSANDVVDLSPSGARDDLIFDFDTCALRVSGDVNGSATAPIDVIAGTGGDQGHLSFNVGMDDFRAVSTVKGDVVLENFDLIQVLPNVSRLVADKPTVAQVTVANNTELKQPVSVHLRVTDEVNTVLVDTVESIGTLEPHAVVTKFLSQSAPFKPTNFFCKDAHLFASADLVIAPGAEPPGNVKVDCWVQNNSSGTRSWDITTTQGPSLTWYRTGDLITATSLASQAQLKDIHDHDFPFMNAVYPVTSFNDSVSTFPLVPPLSGGLLGFVTSIIVALGAPDDYVTPYAMIFEMNAIAAIIHTDRIMGVVPKDWFETAHHIHHTGLSAGRVMPNAVLFEAISVRDDGTGPKWILPGHELGHTYGLSTDPSLKSWVCAISDIACGIAKGFDEYYSDVNPDGVPTWGFWIGQGPISGGDIGPRCGATCMMGTTPVESYASGAAEKWIDQSDYEVLLDSLETCKLPDQTARMFVQGIISSDDSVYLGWTFVDGSAHRPTFADKPGHYQTPYTITLTDAKGTPLGVSELPMDWQLGDSDLPIQATFFSGYVNMPAGTSRIQIRNRMNGKLLGERVISKSSPAVSKQTAKVRISGKDRFLDVAWAASDGDGDKLSHFVIVSPDRGVHWWPVAHALTDPKASVNLDGVAKGSYTVRVLTSDGVHLTAGDVSVTL